MSFILVLLDFYKIRLKGVELFVRSSYDHNLLLFMSLISLIYPCIVHIRMSGYNQSFFEGLFVQARPAENDAATASFGTFSTNNDTQLKAVDCFGGKAVRCPHCASI